MTKILAAFWLIMAPLWANAQEGSSTDALLLALEDMHQLQGHFVQQQYAGDDALLVESSGRFRLLRPGYFAWEIQSPERPPTRGGPRPPALFGDTELRNPPQGYVTNRRRWEPRYQR